MKETRVIESPYDRKLLVSEVE